MHRRDNTDKLDAQSGFGVNKNMESYPKSRTEISGGIGGHFRGALPDFEFCLLLPTLGTFHFIA